MSTYWIDITVKVEADDENRAWERASEAANDLNAPDLKVVEVSTPDA